MSVVLKVNVEIFLNGKPIVLDNFHCSLANTGFNHFGNRVFNSGYGYGAVGWINYVGSVGGPYISASTYSELATNKAKHTADYTMGGSVQVGWTGASAQFYNSSSATYNHATASWSSVTVDPTVTMRVNWTFEISGTDWTTAGLQQVQRRVYDNVGSHAVLDHTSILVGGAEAERPDATYRGVSDTVHELIYTPTANRTAGGIKIFDAASSGNDCFGRTFPTSKYMKSGKSEIITVTLTNPSTTIT